MSESHIFNWTLAPGSWLLTPDTIFRMVTNRCLKMRAPVNVKDGVRFPVVVVTSELSYNSGRNNSFHVLKIGFVLFVLFSPKTTWFGFWCVNWWLRNFSRTASHDAELHWTAGHRRCHGNKPKRAQTSSWDISEIRIWILLTVYIVFRARLLK